jgi:ribonuclease HI
MSKVTIYTDGSSKGNPGPGGFGVVLKSEIKRLEISRGFRCTTNSRMELSAVVAGLEALKRPLRVTLYSDSKYVVDAINQGWLRSWMWNGWRKADNKPVMNTDLWKRIVDLMKMHDVQFVWVKSHSGNIENEKCDWLATNAAKGNDLAIDFEYERIAKNLPPFCSQGSTIQSVDYPF